MSVETPRELPARRGFSVFYRGKTLLSRIDPIAQAERLVEGIEKKERTLYFIPSPLYGYGIPGLLEKLGENSAVLCAEADEGLLDFSLAKMGEFHRFGEGAFPRLSLVRAKDAANLCAFVRQTWGSRVFRRVEVLRLSGGWRLYPEWYEALAAALGRDIATDWENAMTLIRLGRRYVRNAIKNLRLIPQSLPLKVLSYEGSPVLVLGAGPSLDLMLDALRRRFGGLKKDRPFRIICVDTCLPALDEWGIEPDLAVILESQVWNLRDFIGSSSRPLDAAGDLSALPASLRVLGGRRFLFSTPWTGLRLFKRLKDSGLLPGVLPPLGSVGLSAVEIARRSGGGPVITAGIDFSFTLDNCHARSTPAHLEGMFEQNRFRSLLRAETAFRRGVFRTVSGSGAPVLSNPAMRNYRDLFEETFSSDPGIFALRGPGLPLGLKTLSPGEVLDILARGAPPLRAAGPGTETVPSASSLRTFVEEERDSLLRLRLILSGGEKAEPLGLEKLLDRCDYLWAHFPECAGAGGRRPGVEDLSFLKRVRAEIDPFLRLWEFSL